MVDYELGLALGRHWAERDATESQRQEMLQLGSGIEWIADREDAAADLRKLVAPDSDDFLATGGMPSNQFIAGFIDGVHAFFESHAR